MSTNSTSSTNNSTTITNFTLKKLPIVSINTPIIMTSRQNSQSESSLTSTATTAESDLTELSWLTNNQIQLFPTRSANFQQQQIVSLNSNSNKILKNNHSSNFMNRNLKQTTTKKNSASSSSSSSLHLSSSSCSNNSFTSSSQTENTPHFKNNCGSNKPMLTLSCLIFMSIEESDDKCLPVREIYEWIQCNFPYYKHINNPGWKSSVRHNLSFSKCFKKQATTDLIGSNNNRLNNDCLNRKRRRQDSGSSGNGTFWTVSEECKLYLIQTLKKSSFWHHNSKFYPKLCKGIEQFLSQNKNMQLIPTAVIPSTKSSSDIDVADDEDLILNQKKLIEFIQREQENLENLNMSGSFENENGINEYEEEEDIERKALAAIIDSSPSSSSFSPNNKSYTSSCSSSTKAVHDALSLSSSASSLSSAFALLSASSLSKNNCNLLLNGNKNDNNNKRRKTVEEIETNQEKNEDDNHSSVVNSDLEIEVASTLVGMKWSLKK
jgi:hypothetical protein